MATTVKTVETELQRRLRIGIAQTAITDANLFDVMNKVQHVLNYALNRKVTTGTLTEATGTSLYYCTASIAADCLKVIAMHEAGSCRTVMPLRSWQDFAKYDRNWLYSTAGAEVGLTSGRVEAWAHVGRNMVAIYPASSGTVSCVYLQETTTLNSSGDTFNLDDKDIELVYDLCEIVWHLHLRNYNEVKIKAENFKKTIAPYVGGE